PLPAPVEHAFSAPLRSPQPTRLKGNPVIVYGEGSDPTGINAGVVFNPLTSTETFRAPLSFTARRFRLTDQKEDIVFIDRENPALVEYSIGDNKFGARLDFAPGVRPLDILFSRSRRFGTT